MGARVSSRDRRSTVRLAILSGIVSAGLAVLIAVNLAASGTDSALGGGWPVFMTIAAIYGFAGVLLVGRMPRNPIGWLMFLVASGLGVAMTGVPYATISYERYGGQLPLTSAVAWLSEWLVVTALQAAVLFMPLLFPSGTPPGPRWRWVVRLTSLLVALSAAVAAFTPGPMQDFDGAPNPFGIDALAPLAAVLGPAMNLLPLLVVPAVMASPFVRYRRAGVIERLQLRWFALGVVAVFATVMGSIVLPPPLNDASWTLVWFTMGFLPVAVMIAILRYRLYDIDRLISRTLGWALTSGAVLAVFGIGMVLLQSLLAGLTQGGTLAVAASTLAAFAAFQPVRRRIQRAVDHRFHRARYDGERTAAAFASTLRAGTALDAVAGELAATAKSALEPSTVQVWLRGHAS